MRKKLLQTILPLSVTVGFFLCLEFSFAATDSNNGALNPGIGLPVFTPTTSHGYVLASGIVSMNTAYQPMGNSIGPFSLIMNTNGTQCDPNTLPTVNLSISYAEAWESPTANTKDIALYPIGPSGGGPWSYPNFPPASNQVGTWTNPSTGAFVYYYTTYVAYVNSDDAGGSNVSFQWILSCVPSSGITTNPSPPGRLGPY